jgi:chaperonin GroES
MDLKPLDGRIVVEAAAQDNKTAGGILIPDNAKEKPMKGTVVAVSDGIRGDDGKVHPLTLKAGDKILYGKWGGTEISFNGKDYLIMKESDVLAIIK